MQILLAISVLKLLFERYLGVFLYLGPSQKQLMDKLHPPKSNQVFLEELVHHHFTWRCQCLNTQILFQNRFYFSKKKDFMFQRLISEHSRIYLKKKSPEFLNFSLYLLKFQRKQIFTFGYSKKWCGIPFSQSPVEIPLLF